MKKNRELRGGGGKALTLSLFCAKQVAMDGPLPINDLFWRVLDSGLQVGGIDEKSVLSGYLSRKGLLNYTRDNHSWHLTDIGRDAIILDWNDCQ